MRILVVEDDKDVAAFVVKGLREAGHVVEHTGNGRDGTLRGPIGRVLLQGKVHGEDGKSRLPECGDFVERWRGHRELRGQRREVTAGHHGLGGAKLASVISPHANAATILNEVVAHPRAGLG